MNSIFGKYFVLLSFIISSVIFFFGGKIIGEYIYTRLLYRESLIDQVMDQFYLTIKLWGVFSFVLILTALAGMLWSKKTNRKELYKGFIFSLIFSLLVFVVYIIALIEAFFS